MKVLGIIPARYGSTRLPGKPLIDLGGKPMIQHVYERVHSSVDHLVVATDDERILSAVHQFGGHAILTSASHVDGTSRCAEAADLLYSRGLTFDVVVNIQGDEPLLDPQLPKELIRLFYQPEVYIGTAVMRVQSSSELKEGHVYAVLGHHHRALYFSRSIIPFQRDTIRDRWAETHTYYHHVGIYAFRRDILPKIVSLPSSPLEEAEKLEQLRWLAAGYPIYCVETSSKGIAVDTLDDAEKVRKLLS